ncbi:unnamed protein product [[Candida] boidinii]|uniref:Unnamed protein product n=1 Tax=Candida boidinii TaxID=5477 RepID=A0ACB5UAX9_CANBO|nr:unnamed protein product [[Candida] boidinii]
MTDITSESIPDSSVPISEKLPEINDITSSTPVESEEPEDNATQNDQLDTDKTEQEEELEQEEETPEKEEQEEEKPEEQDAQAEPTLETEQQPELDEGEGDGAENETINTIEQHNEVEHTQNGNSVHSSPSKSNRRASISSTHQTQFLKFLKKMIFLKILQYLKP